MTDPGSDAERAGAGRAPARRKEQDLERAAEKESPREPAMLAGYGTLLSGYAALTGVVVWAIRRRGLRIRSISPFELVTYALATQHLSRLITKDSITTVMRTPLTVVEEPAGEGELNEAPIGTGLRHAIGELVTCPFCIGQWVSSGLIAGRVALRQLTEAVVSVSATARVADYLQLAYGLAREAQQNS